MFQASHMCSLSQIVINVLQSAKSLIIAMGHYGLKYVLDVDDVRVRLASISSVYLCIGHQAHMMCAAS